MLRFIFWIFVFYLIWRIIRVFLPRQRSGHTQPPPSPMKSTPPFSNIQDAEFEDLTPKSPSSEEEK